MITFIPTGFNLIAICDEVCIPEYGIDSEYTNQCAYPFIYGVKNDGKDFVLLGDRGEAHNSMLEYFETPLKEVGITSRNDVLCARIWDIDSTKNGGPKGLVTAWVSESIEEYSGSKCFQRIVQLLKRMNKDISKYSIVVECYNNLVAENEDYESDGIYIISVMDYIVGNFSSLKDLPQEYKRQQKKSHHSKGNGKPTWHDLPYRLYRWQSDEGKEMKDSQEILDEDNNNTKKYKKMKTVKINDAQIKKVVKECTNKVLKESIKNPRDGYASYMSFDYEEFEEMLSKKADEIWEKEYVFWKNYLGGSNNDSLEAHKEQALEKIKELLGEYIVENPLKNTNSKSGIEQKATLMRREKIALKIAKRFGLDESDFGFDWEHFRMNEAQFSNFVKKLVKESLNKIIKK